MNIAPKYWWNFAYCTVSICTNSGKNSKSVSILNGNGTAILEAPIMDHKDMCTVWAIFTTFSIDQCFSSTHVDS